MSIPDNPFTYGNPITDARRFFGRQLQVEQLFSRLRNVEFESSSLVGERRVGKTSLLYYIADPAVRVAHGLPLDRYVFVYMDLALLDATTTPSRLWRYLLQQIARVLPSIKPAIDAIPGDVTIDNLMLAEQFDHIDAQGQHIVLLLDEFENVTRNPNFGPDFFYSLRSLAIHHNLALITGSRRELIDLTHSAEIRSSPFFNIFANINVPLFTRDEAREFIKTALGETRVQFTSLEIERLLHVAGYHPFFLQTACHLLFDAHMRGLSAPERDERWREAFRTQATSHLQDYWLHSEEGEQLVLTALALLEYQGRVGSRSFNVDQLNRFVERSERTVLRLVNRGLVVARGRGFGLFNSLLGEWLMQILADEWRISPDLGGQRAGMILQALQDALDRQITPSKSPPASVTSRTLPAGLTPREIEVLRLVATGLSDAQVAMQLVVSPRTVSTHLQSIYNKLGVNTRAAATRFAVEQGLV